MIDIADFLSYLDLSDSFAVDVIVDSGGSAIDGNVVGIGIGFKYGKDIMTRWFDNRTDELLKWRTELNKHFDNKYKYLLGWNMLADVVWCKRLGLDVKCMLLDVMLAQRLLDVNVSPLLEDCADKVGMKLELFDDIKKRNYIGIEDYCQDVIKSVILLWDYYKSMLQSQKLYNVYLQYLMPSLHLACDMSYTGIAVDVDKAKALRQDYEDDNKTIISILKNRYNLADGLNLNSPHQVSDLLFKTWKLPTKGVHKLKDGYYSVDQNVLLRLSAQGYEDVLLILEYRKNERLISTFLDALINKSKRENGYNILRSVFKVYQAATGRWASENPNLQNIPGDKEIRNCFIARDGYKLVVADYDQLELRLMAHFSQDKELLNAYKKGEDIHQKTADYLGCERSVAKGIDFGLIYGAGPRTLYEILLQNGINLEYEKLKMFREKFFELYKGVMAFIKKVYVVLSTKKYVESLLGRRRYFNIVSENDIFRYHREAVNSVIQMSASDLMYIACAKVFRYLDENPGVFIPLLQVHDELVCEAPADVADNIANVLKDIMESVTKTIRLRVPIVVKSRVCDRWGE